MTRGEAEAHCAAATLPEHEAEPAKSAPTLEPSEHTTAEAQEPTVIELSPWQACIKEQLQTGMTPDEAAIKCEQAGLVKEEGHAPEIPGAKKANKAL